MSSATMLWGEPDTLGLDLQLEDVPTQHSAQLRVRLSETMAAKRIMIVFGDYGVGKTYGVARACEHYIAHEDPAAEVSYVRLSGSGKDRRMYVSLLNQVAGRDHPESMSVEQVRSALSEQLREQPRIIVIDEVQRLAARAQQAIQEVADTPGRQSGIVMIGDSTTPKRLLGEIESRAMHMIHLPQIDRASCPKVLAKLHPILAATDPKRLQLMNDQVTFGKWREWVRVLALAAEYGADDRDGITDAVLANIPRKPRIS